MAYIVFLKDQDVIDSRERRYETRAILLAHQRTALALEAAHAGIAVDADNQQIAGRPGSFEITQMPDMQQVEAAIGQHDAFAGGARRLDDLRRALERNDLGLRASQSASLSSRADTVAVPRFITTMPPA